MEPPHGKHFTLLQATDCQDLQNAPFVTYKLKYPRSGGVNGYSRRALTQLPVLNYNSLALPFVTAGLGAGNSYIDTVVVGMLPVWNDLLQPGSAGQQVLGEEHAGGAVDTAGGGPPPKSRRSTTKSASGKTLKKLDSPTPFDSGRLGNKEPRTIVDLRKELADRALPTRQFQGPQFVPNSGVIITPIPIEYNTSWTIRLMVRPGRYLYVVVWAMVTTLSLLLCSIVVLDIRERRAKEEVRHNQFRMHFINS